MENTKNRVAHMLVDEDVVVSIFRSKPIEFAIAESSLRSAEFLLETRRLLDEALSFAGLSASPALDMLFHLYIHGPTTEADSAAAGRCSVETGKRWLAILESKRLLARVPQPEEESVHFQLMPETRHKISEILT